MTPTDDLAAMDAAIRRAWERVGVKDSGAVLEAERRAYRAGHAAGVIEGMRRAAEIAKHAGPLPDVPILQAADALEGKK